MVSAVQHITGGRGSEALTFILAACHALVRLRACGLRAFISGEIDELDSVQLVVRDLGHGNRDAGSVPPRR